MTDDDVQVYGNEAYIYVNCIVKFSNVVFPDISFSLRFLIYQFHFIAMHKTFTLLYLSNEDL
jgi:hypothetical protein